MSKQRRATEIFASIENGVPVAFRTAREPRIDLDGGCVMGAFLTDGPGRIGTLWAASLDEFNLRWRDWTIGLLALLRARAQRKP